MPVQRGQLIIFWKIQNLDKEENSKGPARVPLLRFSYAFNISQTSLYKTDTAKTGIISAEELISKMQNIPTVKNNYRKCVYNLIDDFISLPVITDFDSQSEYYSSFFMNWSTLLEILQD